MKTRIWRLGCQCGFPLSSPRRLGWDAGKYGQIRQESPEPSLFPGACKPHAYSIHVSLACDVPKEGRVSLELFWHLGMHDQLDQ